MATKRETIVSLNTNEIKKQKSYIGLHLIADFWGAKVIEDPKKIEKILILAAKKANNTPLKVNICRFSPYGITAVILLAESHISLHSWVEFNYLAVDVFTCGKKTKPHQAIAYLKKIFKPQRVQIKEVRRGKTNRFF